MTTVFLDTAIIMYAAGRDHPLRAPCAGIIDRVAAGDLDAVISAEVIQEIVHRLISRREHDMAKEMASHALSMFAPVLPVTDAVMYRVVDLVERYQGLRARDLVHIATCLEEGIDVIVSPDRHYDQVREIRRIAPDDTGALA